jgi:cytochrome c biogenesis protein CcmG/thiol:disulfide interchange protein DsbE
MAEQPPGVDSRNIRKPSGAMRLLQALALLGVAGLLVLLALQVIHAGRGAQLVSQIRSGKNPQAPSFSLPVLWSQTQTWPGSARAALADGQIALRELRGHPVVINFWASWCVPCGKEAPLLRASANAHRGRVAFLGVDINDFKSDARRFLRKHKVNFVSVRDGDASVQGQYGLTGVPETYYVNAAGRVVGHTPGELTREDLATGVREAMGGAR